MKNILIIIASLVLISCNGNYELDSDFFYNNMHTYLGKRCNDSEEQSIYTFKLDSTRLIFDCHQGFITKFIITNNSLNKVYTELNYPEAKIFPWVITYDNKNIIGIKESPSNDQSKEIVSIDLVTKEIKTLSVLPYDTYWFSDHPLSENGLLIFHSNKNGAILFNGNTDTLNKNLFKIHSDIIISKNGKKALFVKEQDVYLYDIKTKRKDFIYSSKKENGFEAITAYFGKGTDIIISGVKNPNFKPLQKADYRLIRNKKVIKIEEINFKKGYKYY